jgi:peptidoglycan/LPS O-acetylase OafA/YrhL
MEKSRIDTLTSFRFFMILIIAFSHVYFLGGEDGLGKFLHTHIQNPSLPVEFFFVMSGFGLTYRSLTKGKNAIEGSFTLIKGLKFGIQRMKKLYWLYVLTMASMIPLTALWTNWDLNDWIMSGIQTTIHFFADLTLTQSLYGVSKIANELNGPCWFISVLFILYCFYPLLEKLNRKIVKLSVRRIFIILLITEVLSFLLLMPLSYLKGNSPFDYIAYGSPYTRFFSMLSGILICDLYYKGRNRLSNNTFWEIVAVTVALLWIYNMRVYYDPQDNFPVRYPVVAIINNLISLGIVYVFSFEKGAISRILQKKSLIALGGCAMYIYMLHFPVIYNVYGLVNQLLPMTVMVKIFTTVLIFVITGILTYITWKYESKVMGYIDSQLK